MAVVFVIFNRLRLWLYRLLSTESDWAPERVRIFRFSLPFVLKCTCREHSTEADALRFLNSRFQGRNCLPIPYMYDSFYLDGHTYALISKLPGSTLLEAVQQKKVPSTPEYHHQIRSEITAVMWRIWSVAQPPHLAGKVMVSASGHGLLTNRDQYSDALWGPLPSRIAYNRLMTGFVSQDVLVQAMSPHFGDVIATLKADPMVFAHTDLTMPNVLVANDGHLSGIIDWENTGWLPMAEQWSCLRKRACYSRKAYSKGWAELDVGDATRRAYSLVTACHTAPMATKIGKGDMLLPKEEKSSQ